MHAQPNVSKGMTQQQLNIKHHNFFKIWVNLCIYTLKNLPQAKQSPQISSPSLPESSSSKCEHPVSEQWLGFFFADFCSICCLSSSPLCQENECVRGSKPGLQLHSHCAFCSAVLKPALSENKQRKKTNSQVLCQI